MHQILKMCGKRSVRLKRFLPPVVTAALSADASTGIKKTPREHPHSVSSIVSVISSFFFPTKSIRTPIIRHHIQKPFKWSGSSSRLSCLYIRHSACCRSYLYSPFTLRLVSSIYLFYFIFAKLVRTFYVCRSHGGPAWFQKMQHCLVSRQRPPSSLHAQQLVFPLAALLETAWFNSSSDEFNLLCWSFVLIFLLCWEFLKQH